MIGDRDSLRVLAELQWVGYDEPLTAEEVKQTLERMVEDHEMSPGVVKDVDLADFGAILEIRRATETAVSGPSYTEVGHSGVTYPGTTGREIGSSGSILRATFVLTTPGARSPLWKRRIEVSPEFPRTVETQGSFVAATKDVEGAVRKSGLKAALRKAQVCDGRGSK